MIGKWDLESTKKNRVERVGLSGTRYRLAVIFSLQGTKEQKSYKLEKVPYTRLPNLLDNISRA